MDERRPSALLEIERKVLRLVMAGRRGKEIAPLLGISYAMVEKHIKNAREKLGGISRMEAARLIAAEESGNSVQILDDQILDLPSPSISPTDEVVEPTEVGAGRKSNELPWPFPTLRRPENDLTVVQRWGWILVLAACVAMIAATLIASTSGLIDLIARF